MRNSDPHTLRAACQRVKDGDRAAFGVIVQGTSARLLRCAARILGDLDEAKDVLQESYLRAFDALLRGRFEDRAEVSTWLYRIVANEAMDALRARKRRLLRPPATPTPGASDEPRMEARAALKQIDLWLKELPPDQRTALVLRELEGLSNVEVATTLDISEGAVEQLLIRARSKLRRLRAEPDV